MKLIVPPAVAMAAALVSLLPAAHAQISPIRVRVEQVAKSETEKFAKTQKRSLKIFVSNSGKEPAELKAKYWFFGREAKGNDVVKLDEGEKPVSVKALGTEMVESATISATFEESHSANYNKGKPGKPTEATGEKILGFSVQILQGEKVVAEYSDPPSMKEQIGKASAVSKPAPKK